MADFDPEAYAAEPAAPPTAAPVFDPEAYAGGDDEAAPENMGVMRPPPPLEQPHTDPAVVDAIRARVAARVAGDPLPPETPALAHFRDNNAALATYKAGASGLSSADGQEALQRADATGLGPEHVAKNLAAVRKQDDASTLKTALSGAPILASFAAQSPAHAAAVKDDAANLSFLEWLFRGVPQTKTVQSWDGSYTVQQDTGEDIIPPAAEQFFAKGMLSLKAAYMGVREQIQRNTDALRAQAEKDGLKGADPAAQLIGRADLDLKAQRADRETPEERAAADAEIAATQELAGAEVPGTSGSLAREMTGASVEALPQLAGLAAAPAPFLFAQTMGSLHNHFSLAKNDDGSPRFTDDQARDLALGGATATTAILGGLGKKLASNTIGKLLPRAAQDSMAEAGANSFVRRLAASPALADRLLGHAVQFKDAMIHGIAFMLGQSVIENLTDQTGNVMTGGKFDPSKTAQAAEDSIDGAMDLLPLVALEPVRASILDTGRAIKAHLDGAHVAAAVEAAKSTKILTGAPDQVQSLLEAQTSADPSKATAYVPVEAFDAAMAKEGHDPAEIASSLSDRGASYQEAKVGSGDVAVPMADVLGKLAPAGLADGLLPDLKLDPDPQAMTPRQAIEYQEAWHGTPHAFTHFDLSHVGEGEGNQTYGHGFYFAENRTVAEHYGKPPTTYRVEPDDLDQFRVVGTTETFDGDDIENHGVFETHEEAQAFADRLIKEAAAGYQVVRVGVPTQEELLDYDKPLTFSPPAVLEKLKRAGIVPENSVPRSLGGSAGPNEFMTGRELYEYLASQGSPESASKTLQSAGVPGLKYRDGGSRKGNGEGTSNFVVWDEKRLRVLPDFKATEDSGSLSYRPAEAAMTGRLAANAPKVEPLVVARALREAAEQAEPRVSAALKALENDHAKLVGFDARLKGEGRIADKIREALVADPDLTPATATEKVKDPLRYTLQVEPDQYAAAVSDALKKLEAQGFRVDKFKNYWGGEIYQGVNVAMHTPTGERMELQFHTPDSYAALKTTHLPYEEYRRADTSPERMQELHAQMADVQSGIAPPPGALGLDFASAQPGAKAPAPSPLAAARARAKDARDLDTALQAYAWDRVSKLKLAEIRPATYRSRAQLAALKMAELARAMESAQQGLQRTKVITPQNHAGEPATYKLVEANDLVTSHTPNSFSPEARYPAGIQERDYLGQQGEQNKVANGAKNLNPALVLADSPTAVDGPPLVTSGPNAYVLGGNGRSMMLRRAYLDGDAGQRYKDALRAKAAHFGIEPSAVDAMKQPVLVRSIDAIPDTAGRAEMTAAVRRYNEGLTQHLSPRLRAVAESKVLTPRTVESIAEILGKGDSSLRDLLRDKPQEFQAILERDGVINNENRAQFVRMGELTDEAKDRIEGMFLGKIMGSGERLEATPPSMTRKVERIAASLLRVAGQLPAADETGDVQGALDLLNDAKRRGMPLDDLLSQVALPGEKPVEAAPRTVAMARLIADKGQKDLGARFKAWAEALAPEKQKGLFAAKPATPEEALKTLFAGEQVDLSGESRKADAAREAKGTAKGPTFELNEQAAKNEAKVKIAKERLSEIQMQHRLNDHMAEAADSFKAEAAKIRDALKDLSTVTKRNVLAQADREVDPQSAPAYSDAHDAIMQALGFQPLSGTPKSIDAGVARIAADDRLNFDPDALKQILAKAPGRQMALGRPITGSIDGLTLDEAKLVKTAVENIRHAARAAIEVTRDEKRATYADDVRQIRDFSASLGKRPPGPPSPSNAGKGAGESAARLLKAVHTGMLKPEVLLRELGPVGEAYFREYLKSRARAEEFSRVIGERMQKALDAMPKEILDHRFDKIAPPRVGNGPDGQPILNPDKWTRQDAMMLFAWAGTDSSMERATKGLGTNEGELHRFFDQLSKAEKDFVQSAIWDVNDQVLKPALVDQTARSTGTPMDTIEARPITTKDGQYRGGFHHASYNREASQRAQARSVFQPDGVGDYYGDLKSGWAVGPASGFTKARVAGAFDVPDLNWSSYPAHVAAVTHYLAVDDFVKGFGGLLRRADARAAIAASPIGSEGLKQLDEFLKTEASGGREAPQGGFAEANRIAGSVIRSRAVQAVFTVNIKTWLQQFSHVIAAAPGLRLGPASVLYGLAKAGTGTIASLAGFTGEHLLHGMGEAMRPYSWAAARDASERYGDNELGYRWDRFTDKQRELFGNVEPGQKAGPVGRVVDAMNWTGFHVIDGFLSQWLWHAADLKNRDVPMEQRARMNDQAVRDAMPPMALSELSSFARDRGFIGSMLLTKRFQNTLYNLQEIATWQSRTQAFGANSQGLQRAVAITGYAANAWLTYQAITLGAHLVGRYLGGHGRRKDEGETTPQWIARQWLVGNAYPFPFGEELATPLVEHVIDHKPLDRRAITDSLMRTNPPLNWVVDEYSDIGDALTSHKPLEDRAWKGIRALLRVTPTASPLPLINQVRSGADLLRGKTKARGPFDAGSKFTYAPRPGHTETNPLSDISRAIGE